MQASNSRRNAVKAILLIGAAVAGVSGCERNAKRRREDARSRSPLLVAARGAVAPGPPTDGAGVYLALSSLPESTRQAVADDLEAAVASLEARANPLGIDLLDEAPDRTLGRLRRWFLPILAAGTSLAAGRWTAADGLTVEVRSPAANEEGTLAWPVAAEATEIERRARFLAWPVARALLVSVDAPVTARRVADALKSKLALPGAKTALVVDDATCRRRGRTPAFRRIEEAARNLSRFGKRRSPPDPLLKAVVALGDSRAVADDAGSLVPWVTLTANELLVVPRLGALADDAGFLEEVSAVLREIGDSGRILNRP